MGFVYRFVGSGTMEEKIYERQVNKSSLGLRVVDEQQVDRHYSAEQLKELYKFAHEPAEKPQMAPPKDPILGEIIRGEKTKDWVCKYHQHDSLLEHRIVIINVVINKNKEVKFKIMVKTRRTTN